MDKIWLLIKDNKVVNVIIGSSSSISKLMNRYDYILQCDGCGDVRPSPGFLFDVEQNKFTNPNDENDWMIIENNTLIDRSIIETNE